MQIFVDPKYDFIKYRFHAVALSVLFILAGLAAFAMRGMNVGIDFAGGASVILRFKEAVPLDQLRARVADASIQQYGKQADNAVLIRLPQMKQEGDYAGRVVTDLHKSINKDPSNRLDLNYQGRDALAEVLKAADPDRKGSGIDANDYYYRTAESVIARRSELGIFRAMSEVTSAPGVTAAAAAVLGQKTFLGSFNVLNQETVGPQVGSDLRRKAIWAVVLATLAMGIYITVRFDIKFGIAAMLALVHDVLVAFAFMVMIRAELSLIMVAAFLMIIGYSVNDTVVIYDRVRENLQKAKAKDDYATILNQSLNQTLSRTVLTTGSVLLVLLSLILFGGRVIHDFSLVLFVGCIAGTISTLTIVPAFTLAWIRRGGPRGGPVGEGVRVDPTVGEVAARRQTRV